MRRFTAYPCHLLRRRWRSLIPVWLMLICYSPVGYSATKFASSSAPISRTITIATGEYPPWTGSALPHDGYINHIISEAFAHQGVQVTFVYQPWKRAFEEARQGKFDATSYWYESPERREFMLFSDPVITNRIVFFQRREDADIQWQTLADLSAYRMSATLGFTYTDDFHRAIESNVIDPAMVSSDIQNLKLLMAKRIDIFATDEMCGYYMAAQLSLDPRKLKVIEPALSTPKSYLLASKVNPDSVLIIDTFNRGLRAIKANGKYQRILDRADNTSFYNPAPSDPNQ